MKVNLIVIFLNVILASFSCNAQGVTLWGTASGGGAEDSTGTGFWGGTIFSYSAASGLDTIRHSFGSDYDGSIPAGGLLMCNNGLIYGLTAFGGRNAQGTLFSYDIQADTETDLYDFGSDTNGTQPFGGLIQASDGNLYGVTTFGGIYDSGVIFKYDIASGVCTNVFDFSGGANGGKPLGSLLQAGNNILYGLASGGANNSGIIYSFNISTRVYAGLYSFGSVSNDGLFPIGSLMQASDTLLYGITYLGGANYTPADSAIGGTIFSYNIGADTEIVVHSFGSDTDGSLPANPLIQAKNGLLYGATTSAGNNAAGTLYSYNPVTKSEITLYSFKFSTGAVPAGALMQASNGMLYGLTLQGGTAGYGALFAYNVSADSVQVLYNLSLNNGVYPNAGLIEDDIATGISPISNITPSMQIFPNPSAGQFIIQVSGNQVNYQVNIFNGLGEKVRNLILCSGENAVDLNNQPSGIYLISLAADLSSEIPGICEKFMLVK